MKKYPLKYNGVNQYGHSPQSQRWPRGHAMLGKTPEAIQENENEPLRRKKGRFSQNTARGFSGNV